MNYEYPRFATFKSRHGIFTFLAGEEIVAEPFRRGEHWEEGELDYILSLLPRGCNAVEVGAHVGTHTVPYARAIAGQLHAFEPQAEMFGLLCHNIEQNHVTNVVVHRSAVCHYGGITQMADTMPDGSQAGKSVDYACCGNFGGLHLGRGGEKVPCVRLDDMGFDRVGFIHVDAQGAEPLVLWGARELIRACRPILYYEVTSSGYYRDLVRSQSPRMVDKAMRFDAVAYCRELGYANCSRRGEMMLCLP